MVILAIYTGMRESEIFKLKPEKIDFIRHVINVTETKSGLDRQVPISNAARGVLIQLVERAQTNSWEYLFTNPETGKRYTTIKTAWATACRKAEIKGLRFHDLRHTFGTRAADAGVPLTAIARVMGHSSTQTTEGYAHATDEGKRRAVEAAGHIAVTKSVEPVRVKVVNG
jgi:integrase